MFGSADSFIFKFHGYIVIMVVKCNGEYTCEVYYIVENFWCNASSIYAAIAYVPGLSYHRNN